MAKGQKKITNNIDWKKVSIGAIVLLIAAVIAIICICNPSWFEKDEGKTPDKDNSSSKQVIAISDTGEKMLAGGTYVMPEAMTIVAEAPAGSNYAQSGEFTLTANLSNEYINGNFNFTCYFPEGSDDWANSKEASECIEITPITSSSAKVKLLAAFGAPIEIKAQLIGSESFATCRVDYLQRIVDTGRIYITASDFDDEAKIDVSFNYSIGTVKGDWEFKSAEIALNWNFIEYFEGYLKFEPTYSALELSSEDISSVDKHGNSVVFNFGTWKYSMFIKDFNSYNEQQKNAIYYAWYAAYNDFSGSYDEYNLLVDIDLSYTYHGAVVATFNEQDSPFGLTGFTYGEGISPDVKLNGGTTF